MHPLVLAFLMLAGGLLLVARATGFDMGEGLQRAWASFFRGPRALPWPVGVQEEDDERPWGKRGGDETSGEPRRVLAIDGAVLEELPGRPQVAPLSRVRRR